MWWTLSELWNMTHIKTNHKHRTHLKKLSGLQFWLDKKLEQISIICSPDVNYIWKLKTIAAGLWSSWTGSAIHLDTLYNRPKSPKRVSYLPVHSNAQKTLDKEIFLDWFHGSGKGEKKTPLKFRVILIVLTLLNLNMTTKLSNHPPRLRRRDSIQNYVHNKKNTILVFDYNIQCQIMNSASIYSIITTKKSIKHPLCLLFHLTFASWCLPYKIPAVISQYIWPPISTVPHFHLGDFLMENFAMLIAHGSHLFRNKIRMGMRKMKVQ